MESFSATVLPEPDRSPTSVPLPAANGEPPASAVVVAGSYCENDHFNSPKAPECAVCGAGMPQPPKTTGLGPRPPVGVLILDDGTSFLVDTPYVVGRDPDGDEEVLSGRARPLRLGGGDAHVAPIHAWLQLVGWDLRVIDLDSAGATHVCPPGGDSWTRIEPDTPTTIEPGSRVLFGRTVFRFEAHRRG
jgi:hypothetical protein